jgi:hypothetical protein
MLFVFSSWFEETNLIISSLNLDKLVLAFLEEDFIECCDFMWYVKADLLANCA